MDYFQNGLCFYCHLVKSELLTYSDFHSKTELSWKREDEVLQSELASILEKYPEVEHQEIVESHAWDLHLNQSRYPDIHRNALVIAIYAFLEDQLNGLCETLGEALNSPIRLADLHGQGIERALLFLSKVAQFDLGAVPTLSFVRHVNRLRNKLVHASGVLPDDPADGLNLFVKTTPGLRGEPGGRVHINSDFNGYLTARLTDFFEELDGQVKTFMTRNP